MCAKKTTFVSYNTITRNTMDAYNSAYIKNTYACKLKNAKDLHAALEAVKTYNESNYCTDDGDENVRIEESVGFVLFKDDVFLELINFGRRRQTYKYLYKTTRLSWLYDDTLPSDWMKESFLVAEAFDHKEAKEKFYRLIVTYSK